MVDGSLRVEEPIRILEKGNMRRPRPRVKLIVSSVAAGVCFMWPEFSAASGRLLYKLTAPDPQPGARFGEQVTTFDGHILVGESNRSDPAEGVGRAYLVDSVTGEIKFSLNNPEPKSQDSFAIDVAGGDGRIFVSAIGLEERVYVFDAQTGNSMFRIDDPNGPEPGELCCLTGFGSSLVVGDESLLVSAPSFDLNAELQNVGQAYLFNPESGQMLDTLANPEPNSGDLFGIGNSLAVLPSKMIVGAFLDDLPESETHGENNPGRVWLFDRDTSDALFTIENPQPESPPPLNLADWFGWSVAANDDIVVVGSQEDETSGIDGSGTVYAFDSQTGELLHTLFSPLPTANGEFGQSVAITPDGDILVGESGASVAGFESAGYVYLFDGETGSVLDEIPNPEPSAFAQFGWSIDSIDSRIIVGSLGASATDVPASGAVYVFSTVPEPGTLSLTVLMLFSVARRIVGKLFACNL